MGRAVLYGTGAAIAGMIGLAIVLSIFNAFRIVSSIAVAYLVARAIGKATGNYRGRRYQVLAVGLTYASLGLGMLIPVMRAAGRLDEVKAPPKLEARHGPAGESAEFDDEIRSMNSAPREGEDPAVAAARADSIAAADSVARLERTRANMMAMDGNAKFAGRLAGGAVTVALGAVALLFVLPILSSFAYGLYAGVIAIFALGFALRRTLLICAAAEHGLPAGATENTPPVPGGVFSVMSAVMVVTPTGTGCREPGHPCRGSGAASCYPTR